MRFRVFIAALVAIIAIGAAAVAKDVQGKCSPAKRHRIEQRIVKELGLTNQQVRDLRPIVKKYEADVKGVRDSNLPDDQKRARIADIREQEKKAVSERLSPDQMKKAEAMWAKYRRGHGMRMAFSRLNLNDSQKATIKGIFQDAKAQAKAIKSDTSLSDAARKAKFQELRKATREHVMSVLTPDQRAKLDAMKKRHDA